MKSLSAIGIVTACLTLLTACGGGGTGPDGDNSQTLHTRGAITGFGSVHVNGTRFNTDYATVERDGQIVNSVLDLKRGMVVTVASERVGDIASTVRFDEDVKGPLDIEAANFLSPVSVMGQTVVVDSATVIDNNVSLPIAVGQVLEISGMRQADDSIMATFIEAKSAADVDKFEVIGNVRSLDTTTKTFKIDNLVIDYSAADVSDLSGGKPAEGQLVEVKDENKAYVAGSGRLSATKVEPANPFGGDNRDDVAGLIEIESVVTAVPVPGSQFQIPNFTVNILPNTAFRFGVASEIGVGTILKIKALVKSSGVLDAVRITFKRNSARIEAPVDSNGVDAANNRVTVLGVTVQINASTDMEDDRDDREPFVVGDISANDYLEIRGFLGASGNTLIASRLERDDSDSEVEIRSVASAVDPVGQSVTIFGITVTAGSGTEFQDDDGDRISAEQFFNAIVPGLSIVEAKWDPFSDTSLPPKELELEEQDLDDDVDDDLNGNDDDDDSDDD